MLAAWESKKCLGLWKVIWVHEIFPFRRNVRIPVNRPGMTQTLRQVSSPLMKAVLTATTQRPNNGPHSWRARSLQDQRRCIRSGVQQRVRWWFDLNFFPPGNSVTVMFRGVWSWTFGANNLYYANWTLGSSEFLPYSPDLVPCNLFLFSYIKISL